MVHFDQNRVAHAFLNAARQTTHVGDKQVVAHELNALAEHVGQLLPCGPIVLVQSVLDGHDGVLVAPAFPKVHHFSTRALVSGRLKLVKAAFLVVELRGCGVHGQKHVFSGTVSRLFNGAQNDFHGFFVASQIGGKSAFVSHVGAVTLAFQHALQVVEDLRAHAQAVREGLGAHRHHHEFLDVNLVVRVRAAVQDVHHGNGQRPGIHPTHVPVQGLAQAVRSSACHRKAHAENGVGPQIAFVLRAVDFKHGLVNETLVGDVEAHKRFLQFNVDVRNGFLHALAHPSVSAIAKLNGFVDTRRRSRRNRRTAK